MNHSGERIRVGVIYGGRSGEHEISLMSAAAVIQNLDPEKYEVIPIAIDKQGKWWINDLKKLSFNNSSQSLPLKEDTSCALDFQKVQNLTSVSQRTNGIIDVFFPVVHGVCCEDGSLQGFLETLNLPYVGAGVMGSALGMDKDVSKRLVQAKNIPTPRFLVVKKHAWPTHSASIQKEMVTQLGFPVFIKPANTGSSVGIHKVNQIQDLPAAIEDAFLYDVKVIIEEALSVREIELAVLGNPEDPENPLVSIPGEVVTHHEFYSYEAKYLDEQGAQLLIPALLSPEQIRDAQIMAAEVFKILEGEGMARIDLFLEKTKNKFYFNEVNTIPGFTSISMYSKLWDASGTHYSELLSRLIDLAILRHANKQALKRDWALPETDLLTKEKSL